MDVEHIVKSPAARHTTQVNATCLTSDRLHGARLAYNL